MSERLVEAIVSAQISQEDKTFIEEQNMFFFATIDREGRPNCSYKGGSGMYLSAGNILVNEHVSLLFVDFQRQARLRFNGSAFIQDDDPLMNH
jgi:hypothetical protein